VPIPVQLVPALRAHFRQQDAERQVLGDAWEDWDLVWCQPGGHPIDPHDDWDEWKALLAEAGIGKSARLHDARHTSGTLLGEQHVDMHVIQRILGHAQVSTTRIYTDRSLARPQTGSVARSGRTQCRTQNCNPNCNQGGIKRKDLRHKTPGQYGCAARDLNPEPAD
jgi:integrase